MNNNYSYLHYKDFLLILIAISAASKCIFYKLTGYHFPKTSRSIKSIDSMLLRL